MPEIPTPGQVAEIPPSLTLVTPPEFEDWNGHVNVTHHYTLHMRACEANMAAMGVTTERIASDGSTVFSAEHHLTFLNEIHVGEELALHVRWLGRTPKIAHGISILVNLSTGVIASLCEFVELSIDLTTRRSAPFPDDIAGAIDAQVREHQALSWSVPAAGPMGVNR